VTADSEVIDRLARLELSVGLPPNPLGADSEERGERAVDLDVAPVQVLLPADGGTFLERLGEQRRVAGAVLHERVAGDVVRDQPQLAAVELEVVVEELRDRLDRSRA